MDEQKPPTPVQHYQMVAAAVDEAVTKVLHSAEAVAPTFGAIVAGAVAAVVRYVLQTMAEVPTARNCIAVVIRASSKTAEAMASQGVGRRAALPRAPEPEG